MVTLAHDELRARARAVRLLVTDVDGVLTDGTAYYSARGEEMKRFSLRDGMGVELLAEAGIATAFLTRENSEIVARRAEKLRVPHVFLGVRDKLAFLPEMERRTATPASAMAFIGDDVNDVELLRVIGERGLTAAPADATTAARTVVRKVTEARGGAGAFREMADWILALRSS